MTSKVWNGSSWVAGTPKVWNGSSWVAGTAKVWNGSSWVTGTLPAPTLPVGPDDTWQTSMGSGSLTDYDIDVDVAVGVGKMVVISAACISSGGNVFSVSDTQGNSWTVTAESVDSTTTHGVIAYAPILNALSDTDTITLSVSSGSMQRVAVSTLVFDWEYNSVIQGAWNAPVGTTPTFGSGTANIPDDAVLVGCFGLSNQGRDVTVEDPPWTDLAKNVSTNGGGDRAEVTSWQIMSGGGSGESYDLTLNSSGSGVIGFLAFCWDDT